MPLRRTDGGAESGPDPKRRSGRVPRSQRQGWPARPTLQPSRCLTRIRHHPAAGDPLLLSRLAVRLNDEIDPKHTGREKECGVDKVDFLIGQTDHRTYLEGQLAPGDYEAITSIGTIAPHRLEHLGSSDSGISMCRALLRAAVRDKSAADTTRNQARANGDTLPVYTADSVLNLPRIEGADDNELLLATSKKVVEIMKECDALPSAERKSHVRRRLDDIDGGE